MWKACDFCTTNIKWRLQICLSDSDVTGSREGVKLQQNNQFDRSDEEVSETWFKTEITLFSGVQIMTEIIYALLTINPDMWKMEHIFFI